MSHMSDTSPKIHICSKCKLRSMRDQNRTSQISIVQTPVLLTYNWLLHTRVRRKTTRNCSLLQGILVRSLPGCTEKKQWSIGSSRSSRWDENHVPSGYEARTLHSDAQFDGTFVSVLSVPEVSKLSYGCGSLCGSNLKFGLWWCIWKTLHTQPQRELTFKFESCVGEEAAGCLSDLANLTLHLEVTEFGTIIPSFTQAHRLCFLDRKGVCIIELPFLPVQSEQTVEILHCTSLHV
jgi:hypothetical protein